MAVSKNRIEKNLGRIRENISAAQQRRGRHGDVRIVAVTKSADLDTIKNVLDAGLLDLGENRSQQLLSRVEEVAAYVQRRRTPLAGDVKWHMIGHLQRNKVRAVLQAADVIHSVDSLRLAEEINTRAEQAGTNADVLLQVNCSQESQKFGVAVGAAVYLAELIDTMKSLRLLGLMTMAPLDKDAQHARATFVRLSELFEEICDQKIGGDAFRHLSMGMSQDYTVAVEEGATIVRIGAALFE